MQISKAEAGELNQVIDQQCAWLEDESQRQQLARGR